MRRPCARQPVCSPTGLDSAMLWSSSDNLILASRNTLRELRRPWMMPRECRYDMACATCRRRAVSHGKGEMRGMRAGVFGRVTGWGVGKYHKVLVNDSGDTLVMADYNVDTIF